MSRNVIWALVAVIGGVAGCAGSRPRWARAQPARRPDGPDPGRHFHRWATAPGRPDETPHTVSVNSFYLDKYPVTQELYEKVMGVNPSKQQRQE